MTKKETHAAWIKRNYPRTCEHCGYISNNPSMYHYHKKTHEPIPENTLCDHGCGNLAIHRNTNNKVTCNENSFVCPAYLEAHSIRVTEQWNSPTGAQRKLDTDWNDIQQKGNATKAKNDSFRKPTITDPTTAKSYRSYARTARTRAQKYAKENGHELSQQGNTVDHIVPLLECFQQNLPIAIANHPCNLQVIPGKENSSKGSKIIVTVDELMERINKYNKET